LLERERDWCHSQLPFALPEPLADLARTAGLRTERLTYAYLTLRADGRRLSRDPAALRLISNPLNSKGKTERDGCGEAGLVRLRLLDRDRDPARDAWIDGERGSAVRLDPIPSGTSYRIRGDTVVRRAYD